MQEDFPGVAGPQPTRESSTRFGSEKGCRDCTFRVMSLYVSIHPLSSSRFGCVHLYLSPHRPYDHLLTGPTHCVPVQDFVDLRGVPLRPLFVLPRVPPSTSGTQTLAYNLTGTLDDRFEPAKTLTSPAIPINNCYTPVVRVGPRLDPVLPQVSGKCPTSGAAPLVPVSVRSSGRGWVVGVVGHGYSGPTGQCPTVSRGSVPTTLLALPDTYVGNPFLPGSEGLYGLPSGKRETSSWADRVRRRASTGVVPGAHGVRSERTGRA